MIAIFLWLLLAGIAATLIVAVLGSRIVFHPPKMLRMEIWPDRFGLRYESAEFHADGLTLKGWFIPAAETTERTILLCHGWGDNKGDLLQHTYFLQKDFNLFYFDFRQHGESGGKLSSIGCLETRDMEAALECLSRAHPEWTKRLGAYGHSMGASLAIWAGARHPVLKAVAVEAPFASFNEVVAQWSLNEYRLPYFPFVQTILAVIRLRLGVDAEPFSPLYHVQNVHPKPLLFIAGELDRLAPLHVVRRLYHEARDPKELWVVHGASHGRCETVGGEEYHRRLRDFFLRHL